MDNYVSVLKKYAVFSGRASRSEYWYFTLFNFIIQVGVMFVFGLMGESMAAIGTMIVGLYYLAVLLPSIGVTIRRLHDTDRSGWWLLIAFIPLLGLIVLIVFFVLDSTPGKNRFGENPKGKLIQA